MKEEYKAKQYGTVQSIALIVTICIAIGGAVAISEVVTLPSWLHTSLSAAMTVILFGFDTLILIALVGAAWRKFTPLGFFLTLGSAGILLFVSMAVLLKVLGI